MLTLFVFSIFRLDEVLQGGSGREENKQIFSITRLKKKKKKPRWPIRKKKRLSRIS